MTVCKKCGTIRTVSKDDGTFLGVIPIKCALAEQYGWECGRVYEVFCTICNSFHELDSLCELSSQSEFILDVKAGGQPDE